MTHLLFVDAATVEMTIMQNPALVAVLIGLLWISLVIVVKALLHSTEKRIDERFDAAHLRHNETAKALAEHVKTEETQMWGRLDAIKDGIAELRVSHAEAIGKLSERVTKVETKLPNGALTDALKALSCALGRGMSPPAVRRTRQRAARV
jgi:hypothetical protein